MVRRRVLAKHAWILAPIRNRPTERNLMMGVSAFEHSVTKLWYQVLQFLPNLDKGNATMMNGLADVSLHLAFAFSFCFDC